METPAPWFRPTRQGVEIFVRLTPRSSKDAVEGVQDGTDGRRYLKVRVRAVPEDGRANRALEKLLAKWLGAAPSDVAVAAGAAQRLKAVAVAGDAEELAARLRAALARMEEGGRR